MRYVWVLAWALPWFLFSSLSVPALTQQPMKGDKSWTDLEKVLDDVNQQWLIGLAIVLQRESSN